jgi:nitrous oxide reductase accessory protein NosL
MQRRVFLLGIAAVGLGACGGEDEDSNGPPDISYGEEMCDRCNMVIGEERHAAAFGSGGSEWLLFDDTGEMIMTVQDEGLGERVAWVHDFETLAWVDATAASYVLLPGRNTPMATGIIAFADRARADAVATERGGWAKSWNETLTDWTMESMA